MSGKKNTVVRDDVIYKEVVDIFDSEGVPMIRHTRYEIVGVVKEKKTKKKPRRKP